MGAHRNIGRTFFPAQSDKIGKKVEVYFGYNLDETPIEGEVVRDDYEDPYVMVIKLSDGRYVLATECVYRFS